MRVIVLGTRGSARVMAMVVQTIGWHVLGFVGEDRPGTDLGSGIVLGDDDWLLSQDIECGLVLGIGYPDIRARVVERFRGDPRFSWPSLIHPTALWGGPNRNKMGKGNVASINCSFACDIQVGNWNQFNLACTVGHDANIGDFNVLNPGCNISGYVTMGNRVLIGTGAQVLQHVTIGDDAVVGAGAVVTHDVPPRVTVAGIPAKIMEPRVTPRPRG